MQDVEQVEEHLHAARASALRVRDLHPPLQAGEARSLPLEGNDLAVDHEPVRRLELERFLELRVMVVQSLPVPRQQPDVGGGAEHQAPDTVELRFEDPRRVGEAFLGERREHRFGP